MVSLRKRIPQHFEVSLTGQSADVFSCLLHGCKTCKSRINQGNLFPSVFGFVFFECFLCIFAMYHPFHYGQQKGSRFLSPALGVSVWVNGGCVLWWPGQSIPLAQYHTSRHHIDRHPSNAWNSSEWRKMRTYFPVNMSGGNDSACDLQRLTLTVCG